MFQELSATDDEEDASSESSGVMVPTIQPILDHKLPPKDAQRQESINHPTAAATWGLSKTTSHYNLHEFVAKKDFIDTKGSHCLYSNTRRLYWPSNLPNTTRNMNNELPNHNCLNKDQIGSCKIQQPKSIYSAPCRTNDARRTQPNIAARQSASVDPSAGYNGSGLALNPQQASYNCMETNLLCDSNHEFPTEQPNAMPNADPAINNCTNASPSQPKTVETPDNPLNEAASAQLAPEKTVSGLLKNNPSTCVFIYRNESFGIRNKEEDRLKLMTVLKPRSPAEMAKLLAKQESNCPLHDMKLEQKEESVEGAQDATAQQKETGNGVRILNQQIFNQIVRPNMNAMNARETNPGPANKELNPESIDFLYKNKNFKPPPPHEQARFFYTKNMREHTADNKNSRIQKELISENVSVQEPNVMTTNRNNNEGESAPYYAAGDAKLHGFVCSQLWNCFPPGSSAVQQKQKKRFESKIIKQKGMLRPITNSSFLSPIYCFPPDFGLKKSIVPIKKTVISAYIPAADDLELPPCPVLCPMCQKNYFQCDLSAHIEIDHPSVPRQLTRPLEILREYFDPMEVFLHQNKCLLVCFLGFAVRDFGISKYKDLLPVLVMARRVQEATGNTPIPGVHFPLCIWVCGLELPYPISFRLSIGHGTTFHRSITGNAASIRTEYSAEISPAIIINHNEEHCYMQDGKIELHFAIARETTTRYASGIYCEHVRPPLIMKCIKHRH